MNKRGFTLIELMIAIVMLTTMVLALGRFTGMFQNATTKATILSTMTSIAKERLEQIRSDPRYTTLVARYATADSVGFPGYTMIQRKSLLTRDQ
ncbi:MAG: prepilin-type N-terminal cleavage/methylation domain-containing protein, partial [Gemmatimonadota bacterium]